MGTDCTFKDSKLHELALLSYDGYKEIINDVCLRIIDYNWKYLMKNTWF